MLLMSAKFNAQVYAKPQATIQWPSSPVQEQQQRGPCFMQLSPLLPCYIALQQCLPVTNIPRVTSKSSVPSCVDQNMYMPSSDPKVLCPWESRLSWQHIMWPIMVLPLCTQRT